MLVLGIVVKFPVKFCPRRAEIQGLWQTFWFGLLQDCLSKRQGQPLLGFGLPLCSKLGSAAWTQKLDNRLNKVEPWKISVQPLEETASADLIVVQSSHWKRMVQKQWTVPHDDVLAHSSPVGSGPGPMSYLFVPVAGMGGLSWLKLTKDMGCLFSGQGMHSCCGLYPVEGCPRLLAG